MSKKKKSKSKATTKGKSKSKPVVRGPQLSLPKNAIPLEPWASENSKLRTGNAGSIMHPVVSLRIAPALIAAADKRAAESPGVWPRVTRSTVINAALAAYLGGA